MIQPLEPRCPHKSKMWKYLTTFCRNKVKESDLQSQQSQPNQLVKGGDDDMHAQQQRCKKAEEKWTRRTQKLKEQQNIDSVKSSVLNGADPSAVVDSAATSTCIHPRNKVLVPGGYLSFGGV